MKPKEIRQMECNEHTVRQFLAAMLQEIATQLAEINEHLRGGPDLIARRER